MQDYIYIGESPPEEKCVGVGAQNYHYRARKECAAYIKQIRRTVGEEPEGAKLTIKSCPHDFGTYLTVVCNHDGSEQAVEYALKCECDGPTKWDDQAKQDLIGVHDESAPSSDDPDEGS